MLKAEESNPLVSIVMPVYNGENYLHNTIESVLAQTYNNWELICVNDSSTDKSLSILNNYATKDARIKVFTKENERFGNRATKLGLTEATGYFFIYLSQDDKLSENCIEENLSSYFQTDADGIVPQMEYFSVYSSKTPKYHAPNLPSTISGKEAFGLSINWKIHGFVMWKMSLIKKVGWKTDYINSDELVNRKLYLESDRIAFSKGTFYYHIGNPNAITKKWDIAQLGYIETLRELRELIMTRGHWDMCQTEYNAYAVREFRRIISMFSDSYFNMPKSERAVQHKHIREYLHKNVDLLEGANLTMIDKLIINNFMGSKYLILLMNGWHYFSRIKNRIIR